MKTFRLLALLSAFALLPSTSHAIGIDLLGDLASPLIGPAKDKVKSMLVYIWLQPYAGYASGETDQRRVAAGGATTVANGLSTNGFFYGGRGGIFLMNTFRIGLDYSAQSPKRDTLIETSTGGYVQAPGNGKNTLIGACIGLDIPYTPLRGNYTQYYKAVLHGDSAGSGDGWGAGVSFVLKNPFIFMIEHRSLNYSSATDLSGKKATATMKQWYFGLSFMLF